MLGLGGLIAGAAASSPHILLLYIDDWGWSNAGYHRSESKQPEIVTPNIDALAAEGVKLDRMYAYPFCAPSRASLFSGRLPQNVNTANIRAETYDPTHPEIGGQGVPRNYTTIPQLIKNAGYTTVFAGKWDIGFATEGHVPAGRGFDSSLAYFFQINDYWTQGMSGSEGSSCNKHLNETRTSDIKDLWLNMGPASHLNGTAYEEVLFQDHILGAMRGWNATCSSTNDWLHKFDFIRQKTGADADTKNCLRQVYAAMTHYMDSVVGNITAEFKRLGLWNDTLVIAASDNGGPIQGSQGANNHPLRGGKLTSWEGGVRVNSFISGGFVPQQARGQVVSSLTHVSDIWATLGEVVYGQAPKDAVAEAAGLPPVDSISMWPLVTAAAGVANRTTAEAEGGGSRVGRADNASVRQELLLNGVLYDPTGLKLMTGSHGTAVWTGQTYPNASTNFSDVTATTVHCNPACLFDVSRDPGEHDDLATSRPDDVKRLLARKEQLEKLPAFKPSRGTGLDLRACEALERNGGFWGPWVE